MLLLDPNAHAYSEPIAGCHKGRIDITLESTTPWFLPLLLNMSASLTWSESSVTAVVGAAVFISAPPFF